MSGPSSFRSSTARSELSRSGQPASSREDVDDQPPRGSLVEGCFALPVKGVGFDLREAPPRQRTRFGRSLLHDVIPELAPDLLVVRVRRRVYPVDAPRAEDRIVDPDRRAVPVAGHRHDRRAPAPILAPGDHPHVLAPAALPGPPELEFAVA